MEITVQVIHAFCKDGRGGNPAGVVCNADVLTTKQKQEIASQAGFAETAFVSKSVLADFKLDFFTPHRQIAHCDHAAIAAFAYLRDNGKIAGDISSFEAVDGRRSILFINNEAFMEQGEPTMYAPQPDMGWILRSLNINENALKDDMVPTIVSTGNAFLVIPIKDRATLAGICYESPAVYALSELYGVTGFYLYAIPEHNTGVDATTRMFAPFCGIAEESATGMAAGALAAFLYGKENIRKQEICIEQGRLMPVPSTSLVRVILEGEEGKARKVFAGGSACRLGSRKIEIGYDLYSKKIRTV